MMSGLQPFILRAALPLVFLLVVATIDALAMVMKTTEQRFTPDR
jgi:hypothetical protein